MYCSPQGAGVFGLDQAVNLGSQPAALPTLRLWPQFMARAQGGIAATQGRQHQFPSLLPCHQKPLPPLSTKRKKT